MRITKSSLMFAAAFVLSPPLNAADERPSPQLNATVDGVVGSESQELAIEQLDIEIRRHGSIATTEMTVRFANPSNQTLEGQFALTMPKGSIVTGYALDVNGAMIDGVLQPRDRARAAFDKRVVRRIDPGLAEVDFSDRFETRIYPILARQGRTVRIRFVSPLDADGGYHLPLETKKAGQYSIRVKNAEPASGNGIRWQAEGHDFIASGSGKIDGAISFTVDAGEGLTLSDHPGEGAFFELNGTMAQTAAPVSEGPLTIAWDRSVSRLDDELKREARVVAKIASDMGVDEVRLILFDSGKIDVRKVVVRDLEKALGDVRYAGGTSYDGLAAKLGGSEGTCLLFSDGRVTIGDRAGLEDVKCRLVSISSGKESDRAWLEGQARLLGGSFVDLESGDDRDVVRLALTPARLPKVTDSGKRPIEIRALPSPDGRYRLVGPMPQNGTLVVDGTSMRPSSPLTPNFTGPGALWAAQHIALSRDSMGSEAVAEEARRWSVAVPGVSFIVLETPEDYVEAGFTPPDSYPKDSRARFNGLKSQQENQATQADQAYKQQLASQWTDRKIWWAGAKIKSPDNRQNAEAASDRLQEPPQLVSPSPVPSPPPPPPLPVARPAPEERPSVVEAASDRAGTDNIVVAGTRRSRQELLRETPMAVSAVSGETADAMAADAETLSETDNSRGDGQELKLGIETAEWSVDRPYIEEWSKAGAEWPDAIAKTEKVHGSIPLFYLDLAEWHFRAGRVEEARRSAEAALDLPSKDNQTLAIVAQRLLRYGDADRAIWLLKLLADTEAERPQPLMALARAYADRGRASRDRADIVKAQELMVGVAMKRWDGAFGRIGEIALAEANALIVELGGGNAEGVVLTSEFIDPLPVDLRVVVEWNTPRTDLDLWVREPSGEEVGYSHETSRAGARYTNDITQGYGPEEYAIRRALDGTYRIEINTFSVDRRNPNGPSVVTARLIRNFATDKQAEEAIDVEMQPDAEGRKLVGRIVIK